MPLLVTFEFQRLPMARTLGPDWDFLGPDRDLHALARDIQIPTASSLGPERDLLKSCLTLLETLQMCWDLVGNEIMSYNSYNWIVLSINMTSEDGLELEKLDYHFHTYKASN